MHTLRAILVVLLVGLVGGENGWLINLAVYLDTSGFREIAFWYNNHPD